MKMRGQLPSDIAVCIGCGCDDLHACEDGFGDPCSWLMVDHQLGFGICNGHAVTDQMRRAYRALQRMLLKRARKK